MIESGNRFKDIPHRIHGAGIYANILGVYWWDGIHVTMYSSTMDPMGPHME